MINQLLLADFFVFTLLYNRYSNTKELSNYELRIGYKDYLIYKKPIIINMKITPHIFISGLSGQGKSKMVEYMIQDKKCILINSYHEDFNSLKVKRINENDNILKFFNQMLEDLSKRNINSEPFYIVIDELMILSFDKNISKAIFDLLCRGRHYNVFVIGISQSGTKENVKFKDLFNTRISFRQVEESSYRTVLGYSPENNKLIKREFFLYSHETCRGYTYDV